MSLLQLAEWEMLCPEALRALLKLLYSCLPQNNGAEEWGGAPAVLAGISPTAYPGVFLLESGAGGGASVVP